MLLGVVLLLAVPAPAVSRAMAAGVAPGGAASDSAGAGLTAADTARVDIHFTPLADSVLVRLLRGGGYILAFRHGKTDWTQRDSDVLNYADRAAQRNLSEEGRADATSIGKAIAALRIPIGEVRASPFWRCRDTATLAFGRADTTSALFTKSHAYRRLRWAMLSTPPRKGTNTVLVTHQDALIPLTTLMRDQLREGDALVIQPLGDAGFRAVAQLSPPDWARLAGVGAETGSGVMAPPR
jgi:phosphohistidine phosphatase SixA